MLNTLRHNTPYCHHHARLRASFHSHATDAASNHSD
jgi:hypothetical protein